MFGACLALVGLTLAGATPISQNANFIGEGTSDMALRLLQNTKYQNSVFSPLGYNTLLAIFAEGAEGETRKELADLLHFPDSLDEVRMGYQNVLKRLSEKYTLNNPEMKNWFYIYKNFTVDEDIQNVLRKYYLAEVKTVDRPEDVEFKSDKLNKVKVPSSLQGKPTDHLIKPDEDVASIIDSSINSPHKSDGEEATNSMKPAMSDELKPETTNKEKDTVKAEGALNNNEKVMPEREQIKKEQAENVNAELEKTEIKKEEEKIVKEDENVKDKLEAEIVKEKEEGEKKKEIHEEKETMLATQRNVDSENEINSDIEGAVKVKGKGAVSRILAFNGFFFKGQWKFPFVKRAADESRSFRTMGGKAIVPTLHTEGLFRTADLPELDARAVELKYEGDRYSMLLVLPNTFDGLSKMNFKDFPLKKITERLAEKPIDLCMPSFEIMTISKPSLDGLKFGLEKILKPELADLSGFSKEAGLYLDELVQVVTVEVDSNSTETVLLSAALASSRSDLEKFEVNIPFFFFIRDLIDDIVIINGQVVDPSVRSDMKMLS